MNKYGLLTMAAAALLLPCESRAQAPADWSAKKSLAGSPSDYCGAIAAMIEKRVAAVRVEKATLKNSAAGTPDNMLDLANQWMGKAQPTAKQVDMQEQIDRDAAQIRDLNARYGDEKCGSIDVEREMALDPQAGDQPATPLKTHEKKLKIK